VRKASAGQEENMQESLSQSEWIKMETT